MMNAREEPKHSPPSLFVGLAAAVVLPFVVPFTTADEDFATAMILFGFAVANH